MSLADTSCLSALETSGQKLRLTICGHLHSWMALAYIARTHEYAAWGRNKSIYSKAVEIGVEPW